MRLKYLTLFSIMICAILLSSPGYALRPQPAVEREIDAKPNYESQTIVALGNPSKYLRNANQGLRSSLIDRSLLHSCRWPIDIREPFEIFPYHNEESSEVSVFRDLAPHPGIDIFCAPGTVVRVVQDGMLWGPWGYHIWNNPVDLGVYICIVSPNFVWTFVHVDRKSIPKKFLNHIINPIPVQAGEVIGRVIEWPKLKPGHIPSYVKRVVDSKGTHLHVDVQVYGEKPFKYGLLEKDIYHGEIRNLGRMINPLLLFRQLNVRRLKTDDVTRTRNLLLSSI